MECGQSVDGLMILIKAIWTPNEGIVGPHHLNETGYVLFQFGTVPIHIVTIKQPL